MIKIDYPTKKNEKRQLNNEYWGLFEDNEIEFNNIIKRFTKPIVQSFFKGLSYRHIILGEIKELVDIFYKFDSLPISDKNDITDELKRVFAYDQPRISDFFESHNHIFNLKACHYCNIDSVSVFATLHGYKNNIEFIRYASESELCDIKGIGKNKAKIIAGLPNRNNYVIDQTSPAAVKLLEQNLNRGVKGKYRNSFTLDHYIPQDRCCLFARSLYNFVPSCYVCNSKFKKTHLFSKNIKELYRYSPTYENYKSSGEIKFSLIQKKIVNIFDFSKFRNLKFLNNFEINVEPVESNNSIISILHLRQRYFIHKEEAVRIAYLKEKYSDATIAEIARILSSKNIRTSSAKIKNDIFHSPKYNNESLSKLRQDIIKQIEIK